MTVKALLTGLLLLCAAGTANAASPLDRYLAARDRAIEALNREPVGSDSVSVQEKRALSDLEAMLKAMIGPVTMKGLPPEGRINLETLLKEMGFGRLDGLTYGVPDAESVVVTTDGLLGAWLKGHKDWAPEARMPQDVKGALRREEFYTQAISTDAAIAQFAEIPVVAPKAGFVFAMLALPRQDIGPWMPDRIILSVVQGGRVFIISQPTAVTITPISVCSDIWQDYQKKAKAALDAYRPTESKKDKALFAKYTRLEADGDAEHRRCFAAHLKEQSYFPALVRQTQSLMDRLP
ncbi:hypothetical protein [Azospirillum sp. sgz301742]